jgi:hypothetical protein
MASDAISPLPFPTSFDREPDDMPAKAPKAKKERAVELTESLFECGLFRSLTPAERCVLTEMMMRSKKVGNGRLAFSERDAADRCNISRETARKAFVELTERGFIICVKKGSFDRKNRIASEWRLTMYRCDATGEPATNEFLDVTRERKIAAIRACRGVKFITDDAEIRVSARFLS